MACEDGVSEEALRRADERGASDRTVAAGAWDDDSLPVRATEHRSQEGTLFLDRCHFAQFAQLLLSDQAAEAERLLRPL
ncbi:hypothetical protein [Streptomyces spectabilis]|uniref:Uncharacterized protein n=1 Tax=Streptomyces spectabilis TaxID=68270 RepID=A0A7W8B4F0_STRST|nr:hypothetical protein [Streptomyces spectabilis]MBB5110131.1 hypothetical protein [Streptomyces spectabilis]GGV58816.1 hypothetical protein GCM10010245_91960 [Streptomyces spectabilis]